MSAQKASVIRDRTTSSTPETSRKRKTDEEIQPIGRKLRRLRAEYKIPSIEIMAEMCGVSVPFLSAVETDRKRPSENLLESICKGLDLNKRQREDLYEAAMLSNPEISIPIRDRGLSLFHMQAIIALKRHIEDLDMASALTLLSTITEMGTRNAKRGPR